MASGTALSLCQPFNGTVNPVWFSIHCTSLAGQVNSFGNKLRTSHDTIKQLCLFVHVDPKNITMGCPNLV